MKHNYRVLAMGCCAVLSILLSGVTWAQEPGTLGWQDYMIEGQDGQQLQGQVAYLSVPERRAKSGSKDIQLGFVRLPARTETPGNPIVYLAGGPGGSGTWTAAGPRGPLFDALREQADVIVYDQRGTGLSRNDLQDCHYRPDIPPSEPLTHEAYQRNVQKAATFCTNFWQEQGTDLNGYTTLESVQDLETLRLALGAQKLDLWAISYGTHLALAMAKYHPQSVGRMVLASPEGLDQTIKMPAYADNHLERVEAAIAQDPAARERYPNLRELMSKVHAHYRDQPLTVSVTNPRTGEPLDVGIGELDIQLFTSFLMTRDPADIQRLPALYTGLHHKQVAEVGPGFLFLRAKLWQWNPMSIAMDAASGISATRWQQVQAQAEQSLLWRAHNLPFPDVNTHLGVTDLGAEFRAPFESDIPTLILSGTLDGRTFIESHQEVADGFTQVGVITLARGGHNLFMSSPDVQSLMLNFFAGARPANKTLELPKLKFE